MSRATISNTAKTVMGCSIEVEDFIAMTSPMMIEIDVIISNNEALCVQKQHAPPYQKPTNLN